MNAGEMAAKAEAATFLGREPTDAEWAEAYPEAARKLERIIGREGDADGARRQPWYLGKLVEEAIKLHAFIDWLDIRNMEILAARDAQKKTASEENGLYPSIVYQTSYSKVNRERSNNHANTHASA